jgi:Mrp family chromosome partitioning ATPase
MSNLPEANGAAIAALPEAWAPLRSGFLEYVRGVEFKRILSDVGALQHQNRFQSIVLLSRAPGEGKTFFAAVLALGYALFLRRRVLILDTIAQTSTSALTLAPVLSAAGGCGEIPGGGHVDVVTSREFDPGGQGPAVKEWGADFAIGEYIESIRGDYDLILVDTCSLEASHSDTLDPIVVGRQTDTAILITSPRTNRREHLRLLGEELRRRDVHLLGTIYNGGAQK